MDNVRLTAQKVTAIETILSRGDRVELIPGKDGVKVIRIKRNEIKQIASRR